MLERLRRNRVFLHNKYDPKDIRRRQWLAGPQYDMSGNPLLMQNGQQLDYTPHITSLFDFSNPAKSNEGVRSAKYEYANGLQGECMDNDYVVYRYADVLMMKGEALVRQGHADLAVPSSTRCAIVRGSTITRLRI